MMVQSARPTLTIANASNAFSNAIGTIEYDSLVGLRVIKRTTLKEIFIWRKWRCKSSS